MYFKLHISETGRSSLKECDCLFNEIEQKFETLKEVSKYLIERYGKMPSMKRKIHIDTVNGESEVVGFTHSYWNRDISHNSNLWYQTDWVTITEVDEKPVLI